MRVELIVISNFIENIADITNKALLEIEERLSKNKETKSDTSRVIFTVLGNMISAIFPLINDMKEANFNKGLGVITNSMNMLFENIEKIKNNIILEESENDSENPDGQTERFIQELAKRTGESPNEIRMQLEEFMKEEQCKSHH